MKITWYASNKKLAKNKLCLTIGLCNHELNFDSWHKKHIQIKTKIVQLDT